jgi:hypothetical protein
MIEAFTPHPTQKPFVYAERIRQTGWLCSCPIVRANLNTGFTREHDGVLSMRYSITRSVEAISIFLMRRMLSIGVRTTTNIPKLAARTRVEG